MAWVLWQIWDSRANSSTVSIQSMIYPRPFQRIFPCYMALTCWWIMGRPAFMQMYLILMGISSENLHHGRFHLWTMVYVLVQTRVRRTIFFCIGENSKICLGYYPNPRNQSQYKVWHYYTPTLKGFLVINSILILIIHSSLRMRIQSVSWKSKEIIFGEIML